MYHSDEHVKIRGQLVLDSIHHVSTGQTAFDLLDHPASPVISFTGLTEVARPTHTVLWLSLVLMGKKRKREAWVVTVGLEYV